MTTAAKSATPSPAPTQSVPDGHIHVFFINGADPLQLAGLNRLADKIRMEGYPNTRTLSWHEERSLEREIRGIRQTDPAARFALVGYSAGTYAVKRVATRLVRDGVPVVMVAYIGGDYLRDSEGTRLPGVGRVVNVTGDGYLLTGKNLFFHGTDVTGARNVRLPGTRHFDLPTHPDTVAAVSGELAAASAGGS